LGEFMEQQVYVSSWRDSWVGEHGGRQSGTGKLRQTGQCLAHNGWEHVLLQMQWGGIQELICRKMYSGSCLKRVLFAVFRNVMGAGPERYWEREPARRLSGSQGKNCYSWHEQEIGFEIMFSGTANSNGSGAGFGEWLREKKR
jgi:hypothetical protein